MKGDFSRDSFDASRHDYRVLMQQGRVQLDADWNEQASILLHRLEATIRDLIGPFGGPAADNSFGLFADDGHPGADFGITRGRYYVDGILVENDRPRFFSEMPGSARSRNKLQNKAASYIAYLDVWQEFIAPQQDPQLVDPALDGLDTAARSRIVWRVRVKQIDALPERAELLEQWLDPEKSIVKELLAPVGLLAATIVDASAQDTEPQPALSGYTGGENRLYRVEIHDAGSAGTATFKWSRDNASVALRVLSIADTVISVESFGRDARSAINAGDWIEISDDDLGEASARDLLEVAHADPAMRTITLKPSKAKPSVDPAKHPVLRRWQNKPQPVEFRDDLSIELEAGIAIRFAPHADDEVEPPDKKKGPPPDAIYRAGDYWLIPARTANGGTLLWPRDDGPSASLRPPSGVMHTYAPLAGFTTDGSGTPLKNPDGTLAVTDYRTFFQPLTNPP